MTQYVAINAGTDNRRLFVCGDIHGCLTELESGLIAVGFDKSSDLLIALGDLVDRGPHCAEVVKLLREPWFTSIKGNHEDMMEDAYYGHLEGYVKSGGRWFINLPRSQQHELVELTKDLPLAITVTTRTGRKIGLVHADLMGFDWDNFTQNLHRGEVRMCALTSRDRFRSVANGGTTFPISGIDHVYFGHSPVWKVMHVANMSWIDTGCFHTGVLTIEELL